MARAPVAATFTLDQARSAWAHGLGLHGQGEDPVAAAGACGWARSLGGAAAYLTLKARAGQVRASSISDAVSSRRVRLTPAARGCIYLAPADEAALALQFAADLAAKRTQRERDKAGIEPGELAALAEAVAETLTASGPLTTAGLRKALPDDAVRSLGARGKTVGISSTLPPALRDLETAGRIGRTTEGGRLDTERYLWLVTPEPAPALPGDPAARLTAVVELVVRRGGPISVGELAAFTGAGKRAIQASLAALPVERVAVDGHADEAFVQADRLEPLLALEPSTDLSFLAFEDAFVVWHGGPGAVTSARFHDVVVRPWSRGKPGLLGASKHLANRAIVRGSEVVGFWEYDQARQAVVWASLAAPSASERARIDEQGAELAAWIHEGVGHARTFSLDTDEAVQRRADAIRTQGIAGVAVG